MARRADAESQFAAAIQADPELQERFGEVIPAYIDVPEIAPARCNYCRACAEICQFKAISVFGDQFMTFPEMCHGCGACKAVCPEQAIIPAHRRLGDFRWGRSAFGRFLGGRLRVGEAMSPPLMRVVKKELDALLADAAVDAVFDAPPGVSCPAVNAVMDADVILLVTEPTPFGLYDLRLAHSAFKSLEKPMGVVVNRAGIGDLGVQDFCEGADLPIMAEIPFDRSIAGAYAEGKIIAKVSTDLENRFRRLARDIRRVGQAVAAAKKEAAHG
jgi:MinD superfamily P-loop ATPase